MPPRLPAGAARDVKLTAPTDMRPFAVVSGDHNPIHTDHTAALLAGLESPIVHGMWLSAAAQHVVAAIDGSGKPHAKPPARLIGWTARFLGMVRPGTRSTFVSTASESTRAQRFWRSPPASARSW